jgi:hypothetical protein
VDRGAGGDIRVSGDMCGDGGVLVVGRAVWHSEQARVHGVARYRSKLCGLYVDVVVGLWDCVYGGVGLWCGWRVGVVVWGRVCAYGVVWVCRSVCLWGARV